MVSDERLSELLSYDQRVGLLAWRAGGFRRVAGAEAGVVRSGYRFVTIDGKEYMGARIAWKFVHGAWPAGRIRFEDGDGSNLRIANLRMCDGAWKTKEYKRANDKKRRAVKPDYFRNHDLTRKMGITLAEYTAKLEAQKGVCAICSRPETTSRNGKLKFLAVDHCHATGIVRDLLCQSCNVVLGYVNDSPELLEAAATYLRRHTLETANVVPLKKA